MKAKKEYEGAEEDTTEFQTLREIIAVREAVIKNLEVRTKRDDDKVNKAETFVKETINQPWIKNLGSINRSVESYISANTDLDVTQLSVIRELKAYTNELKTWALQVEEQKEKEQELQELNSDLSIQLKEVDKENIELKKILKALKEKLEALQSGREILRPEKPKKKENKKPTPTPENDKHSDDIPKSKKNQQKAQKNDATTEIDVFETEDELEF